MPRSERGAHGTQPDHQVECKMRDIHFDDVRPGVGGKACESPHDGARRVAHEQRVELRHRDSKVDLARTIDQTADDLGVVISCLPGHLHRSELCRLILRQRPR